MIVTDIKEQLKDEARANIFIDGKYVFAISKTDVVFYNLKVGEELSKDKYDEILENVVLAKAKMVALKFLSYKDRTKREVIRKLKEKEFNKEVTKKTMIFLMNYGYINDKEFSRKFVKNKIVSKGYGKFVVVSELRKKGVSEEIINDVMQGTAELEYETALRFANKKARRLDLTEYKDKQKLYAYLQRRGFSYDIIKNVLVEIQSEYEYELE